MVEAQGEVLPMEELELGLQQSVPGTDNNLVREFIAGNGADGADGEAGDHNGLPAPGGLKGNNAGLSGHNPARHFTPSRFKRRQTC